MTRALTLNRQDHARTMKAPELLERLAAVFERVRGHSSELEKEVCGQFWLGLPREKRVELIEYMRDMEHALR